MTRQRDRSHDTSQNKPKHQVEPNLTRPGRSVLTVTSLLLRARGSKFGTVAARSLNKQLAGKLKINECGKRPLKQKHLKDNEKLLVRM